MTCLNARTQAFGLKAPRHYTSGKKRLMSRSRALDHGPGSRHRLPLATNADRICAETVLEQKNEKMPRGVTSYRHTCQQPGCIPCSTISSGHRHRHSLAMASDNRPAVESRIHAAVLP